MRERRPQPKLAVSLVITMELVATYLGQSQDKEVFNYFRRHSAHFFPAMAQVDRTAFVRQATNRWAVKERLWCLIRDSLLLSDYSLREHHATRASSCYAAMRDTLLWL